MTDWSRGLPLFGSPAVICPFSSVSLGASLGSIGAVGGTTNWPSANRAYYFPFRIADKFLINQFFWINGSAVNGNVDAGVYTFDGTRIISTGAVAQSGTSVIQTSDVADTLLDAGLFYLAVSVSSASGRLLKAAPNFQFQRMLGMLEQSTANPLPATATFAALTGAGHIPVFGIMKGSVI